MSHVGVNLGFGNLHENLTDEQMYAGEVQIAELAERLGFDSLWAVEHHSGGYAMCPATASLELFAKEVVPGARELQG